MPRRTTALLLVLVLCMCLGADSAEARRRRHKARRSLGPLPTHPVVLWSRTLNASDKLEERRIAAFKLSHYSQPIFQTEVVETLTRCMRDKDAQVKVLCTKAMARAGNKSATEAVRKALLERFDADQELRTTITRAFITREDASVAVHSRLMLELGAKRSTEEQMALLGYFEQFGNGSDQLVHLLATLYRGTSDAKIRNAIAKALDRANGQTEAVDILMEGAQGGDTLLALTCMAGLQSQAKGQVRVWNVVEKALESSDEDMHLAGLDLVAVLPEKENAKLAKRVLELLDEDREDDLLEKLVLALGSVGDQSEDVVKALLGTLADEEHDESVRIAAALTLGRQAVRRADIAREPLGKCKESAKTQSLKTACELGLRELESRASKRTALNDPSLRTTATATPVATSAPIAVATATARPTEVPKAAAAAPAAQPTQFQVDDDGDSEE